MTKSIGFVNIDNLNTEPAAVPGVTATTAVTPPAAEAPVVETPAAVAPIIEPAATVEPVVEEKEDEVEDEVEVPKVEDTSDEKYFEHEGVSYIKADAVPAIVAKRVAKLNQDKIQAAAAELSKDALNAKSLLENDNKALKRENEVLKLSKGDETRYKLLNMTKLSGDELQAYAAELSTAAPAAVTSQTEKEFRDKITGKPSTPFNIAAVMSAAREGRK